MSQLNVKVRPRRDMISRARCRSVEQRHLNGSEPELGWNPWFTHQAKCSVMNSSMDLHIPRRGASFFVSFSPPPFSLCVSVSSFFQIYLFLIVKRRERTSPWHMWYQGSNMGLHASKSSALAAVSPPGLQGDFFLHRALHVIAVSLVIKKAD